ncbi:MAG: DUF2953 domain-containing protein [Eubacterium sp.]|uniref:DUF2953 domain-containing protein n=1 Tax=Eubacterium sp. TaxID=142586 RepID=UPI00300EEBA0
MLHILLILLKIIGIILLASLALVALLFILPASYKIEGIKNKEQSYLRIHGGWLFHLLHFNMEYSEELKYSLRILGFKIYSDDNDENADDSYETFENDEKYEKRGRTEDNDKNMNSVESDDFIKAGQEFKGDNIEGKALANSQKNLDKENVDERQSYINKEESSTDEENSALDYKVKQLIDFFKNIWFKCRKLFGKIKHKVRSTKHKFKNNQKKFKYLIEYLKSEEVKTAYNYIKSKTKQIVKLLKPKKIRGKLEFGFDSPDKTGKMLGVIAVVCTALKLNMDNFQIEPDFENKKFNGIIRAWGHFSIGVVGVYILQIYMKDEVHDVIDKFS